ncbi:BLUF domain-containing protein [Inhella gelatinilytica]|uniref:BLUF domain-containing protein n=1 Tax=Inhella gelatinilytica TaxID=2795030 RepID=A0A931ITI7_9BURK|nr:BLUF domain-containing protein [Inhella gelatinilytica]MBH9551682.1 BLUF domain-containing protein [Inhella gelatinilytica]
MLVRLIYASHTDASEADLAAILRASRAHNTAHGITGLLCHNDDWFVQVLEGGREAVNVLYNTIVRDPRHRDVTLLAYQEIKERRFAGWAMGQVNLARLNPALVLRYATTTRLDPFELCGESLESLFKELTATGAIVCS